MPDREPPTETVDIETAREHFDDLVTMVAEHGAHVIITEDGRPLAAIIPYADYERLREADARPSE